MSSHGTMFAFVHDGEGDQDRFVDEVFSAFDIHFSDFLSDCKSWALTEANLGPEFTPEQSVGALFVTWLHRRSAR